MTQSNKMIRPFFDKKKLNNIKKEMMTVDQIPGIQTIWEHGLSVASHYKILITNLRLIASGNRVENEIYIPEALIENAQEILNRITLSDRVMQKYLVFHDIGKPICAIKDEFG